MIAVSMPTRRDKRLDRTKGTEERKRHMSDQVGPGRSGNLRDRNAKNLPVLLADALNEPVLPMRTDDAETSRFAPAVSIGASIQLLGNFLEGVPRQQGHLGCRLSVLQLGNDADRPGPGIRVHPCLCHGSLLRCRFLQIPGIRYL